MVGDIMKQTAYTGACHLGNMASLTCPLSVTIQTCSGISTIPRNTTALGGTRWCSPYCIAYALLTLVPA